MLNRKSGKSGKASDIRLDCRLIDEFNKFEFIDDFCDDNLLTQNLDKIFFDTAKSVAGDLQLYTEYTNLSGLYAAQINNISKVNLHYRILKLIVFWSYYISKTSYRESSKRSAFAERNKKHLESIKHYLFERFYPMLYHHYFFENLRPDDEFLSQTIGKGIEDLFRGHRLFSLKKIEFSLIPGIVRKARIDCEAEWKKMTKLIDHQNPVFVFFVDELFTQNPRLGIATSYKTGANGDYFKVGIIDCDMTLRSEITVKRSQAICFFIYDFVLGRPPGSFFKFIAGLFQRKPVIYSRDSLPAAGHFSP